MSDMPKVEAVSFFSELYFGEHHIPARGCCGAHGVKEFGPGSWYVNHSGDIATYDYDFLTRLVFLAHDKCIRASVQNSGPRLIKIVIWKRDGRTGRMAEGHPTIETALGKWRERHPASALPVTQEEPQ
jgi:hypothetical protein